MLSNIKILLSISDTSKDALLNLLIARCIEEFINYTHNDDTTNVQNLIISMVIYNYNRLGSEGVSSEGYSGVSFGYSSEYPENIMRELKANRKLQVC